MLPLESSQHSQDKTNLGGDSLTHKSHKNCAEFFYSNFNLSLQRGKPPIYRLRSLGKQGMRVEEEEATMVHLMHHS